ncbi:MAG: hypothetical protein QW255_04335 [Candidatus Bilamarchaeaceae archaeon]
MKIVVLLPTYNEEEEIGKILKDIKKLNNEIKSYVVDSGMAEINRTGNIF